MFTKLFQRFISWLYRQIEQERIKIETERAAVKVARREAVYRANVEAILREKQKRQDTCLHRKGGRAAGPGLDFNISKHIFTDGTTVTRCFDLRKNFLRY